VGKWFNKQLVIDKVMTYVSWYVSTKTLVSVGRA